MNLLRQSMTMKAHDGGFSLIEILAALGIVGILIGIAIPAYNGYREKADIAAAQQVLKDIERAIITLATDTGEWPGHQTIGAINNAGGNEIYDLNAATAGLTADDPGTPYPNWNGPYMNAVPLDPWGTNYFLDTDYRIPNPGPDFVVLGSLGPSKCCNNQYNSDDVVLILPLK